jgi:hypothetical protein
MDETPQPRKRGAPRGNTNALKHGYYSRRFQRIELKDMQDGLLDHLNDEIALLRVTMRRVFEQADASNDRWPETLDILARASSRPPSLVRVQTFIPGCLKDPFWEILGDMTTEVLAKHGNPIVSSRSKPE